MRKVNERVRSLIMVMMLIIGYVFVYTDACSTGWQGVICIGKLIALIFVDLAVIWIYNSFVSGYMMIVKMKDFLLIMFVAFIIFLSLVVGETNLSGVSVMAKNEIIVGFLTIEKTWIFGLWVILLFPAVMLILKKTLGKSNKNKLAAACVVISMTMLGFLLFYKLGNAWLVNMAVLNTIAVCMLLQYMNQSSKLRIGGKCVLTSILYAVFWGFLLLINSEVEQTSVLEAIGNSISRTGWKSVLFCLCGFILFLLLAYQCLGRKYRMYKTFYLVYVIAFSGMVLRAVYEFLWHCGWRNTPENANLGNLVFIMDSFCLALLIYSECENCSLNRTRKIIDKMQFKKVSEFLPPSKNGEYDVRDVLYDMDDKIELKDILFGRKMWTMRKNESEAREKLSLLYICSSYIGDKRYKIYMVEGSEDFISMEIQVTYTDGKKTKKYIGVENEDLFLILESKTKKHLVRRCLMEIGVEKESTKTNIKEFLVNDLNTAREC